MPITTAKPLEIRAGSDFTTVTVTGGAFAQYHYNNRVTLKFVSVNQPVTSAYVIVENPPLPDDYSMTKLKFRVKATLDVLDQIKGEIGDNRKFQIVIEVLDPDDGSVTDTLLGPPATYIEFT